MMLPDYKWTLEPEYALGFNEAPMCELLSSTKLRTHQIFGSSYLRWRGTHPPLPQVGKVAVPGSQARTVSCAL